MDIGFRFSPGLGTQVAFCLAKLVRKEDEMKKIRTAAWEETHG
jgi:hypothetical protein